MARLAGVCAATGGPPSLHTANRRRPRLAATLQHMARLWPAYLMRHGPFLVRLVVSNEKAWIEHRYDWNQSIMEQSRDNKPRRKSLKKETGSSWVEFPDP